MRVLLCFFILFNFSYAKDFLIEKDFKKKTFKNPIREFSIIVTDDGFYPNKIMAFVGERVRFFVTTTTSKSQCFVLQKHEVFISAEKGLLNEGETLLENAGRYRFYCPSSKYSGHLTVVDKMSPVKEKSRTVASEKKADKPKYWTPRDYDE